MKKEVIEKSSATKFKKLEEEVKKVMSVFDAKVEIKEKDNSILVNISSSESGHLIGHFGQTLTELQHLIRLMANKIMGERVSLTVDVENYKANKNRELEELALSCAENVSNSGYPQTLKPMNAYDRRIIHVALKEFPGVEVNSIGDEPNRCIEIKPTDT